MITSQENSLKLSLDRQWPKINKNINEIGSKNIITHIFRTICIKINDLEITINNNKQISDFISQVSHNNEIKINELLSKIAHIERNYEELKDLLIISNSCNEGVEKNNEVQPNINIDFDNNIFDKVEILQNRVDMLELGNKDKEKPFWKRLFNL